MKMKLVMAGVLSAGLLLGGCGKNNDPKPTPDPTNQNPGGNNNPEPDPKPSSGMTAKVNGSGWSASQTDITLSNGLFTLTGMGANETAISITAKNVTQTGTYGQSQGTQGTYLAGYGNTGKTWSSALGGTATITITKLDLAAKKASGSFSLTASPAANATGTINVTEGIFTDLAME